MNKEEKQSALTSLFNEAHLPHNTYCGDGSHIATSVPDKLRRACPSELPFSGSLMIFCCSCTCFASHGRKSDIAPRKVLVGRVDSRSRQELTIN